MKYSLSFILPICVLTLVATPLNTQAQFSIPSPAPYGVNSSDTTASSSDYRYLVDRVPSHFDVSLSAGEFEDGTFYITDTFGAADMKLKDGPYVPVIVNEMVHANANISTGYGGTVTLQLANELVIILDQRSKIDVPDVTDGSDLVLKLVEGEWRLRTFGTDREITIVTGDLALETSGADLSVAKRGNESQVEVYDGSATLTVGERTENLIGQHGQHLSSVFIAEDGEMIPVMGGSLAAARNTSEAPEPKFSNAIGLALIVLLFLILGSGGAAASKPQ